MRSWNGLRNVLLSYFIVWQTALLPLVRLRAGLRLRTRLVVFSFVRVLFLFAELELVRGVQRGPVEKVQHYGFLNGLLVQLTVHNEDASIWEEHKAL